MKPILCVCLFTISLFTYAQDDIVAIVDDLTIQWDKQAVRLETYVGLKDYCTAEQYRDKTLKLLD